MEQKHPNQLNLIYTTLSPEELYGANKTLLVGTNSYCNGTKDPNEVYRNE